MARASIRERIKNKALERGMITPQQAARMSEREALNLVFLPGFPRPKKSPIFPAAASAWMW